MLSLISAISNNNVIGVDNDLPWHIPEDLKHFREKTRGKTVLMGRKTWESLPEQYRPLPKRLNIIITRQEDYTSGENIEVFSSIDAALLAHKDEDIMVIGGGGIYAQTIDIADTLYITHVNKEVEGDVVFPDIHGSMWKETERDDRDGFSFVTYERK